MTIMAKQISMPPPGMSPMNWKFCVAFGDKLEFVLPHPGFLDHSTDGLFNPDLPASRNSLLPAGVIGPFSPVGQSGEVVLGYLDDTTKELILVTLIIQPTCP
jgi:hypothetical protein